MVVEPPYPIIWDRMKAAKVIPFLGAGASIVGRPPEATWRRFGKVGTDLGQIVFINSSGGVDAHFTTSPFHEQEIKVPGVRTLTTNYKILGGPATALLVATSTKFRDENPKSYRAFYDAMSEAIAIINKDKRAAAKAFIEQTKDTKNTVDDVYTMINSPDYIFTQTPQKIGVIAEFMHRSGSIKTKPASWKEMFFPEVQRMPGD